MHMVVWFGVYLCACLSFCAGFHSVRWSPNLLKVCLACVRVWPKVTIMINSLLNILRVCINVFMCV